MSLKAEHPRTQRPWHVLRKPWDLEGRRMCRYPWEHYLPGRSVPAQTLRDLRPSLTCRIDLHPFARGERQLALYWVHSTCRCFCGGKYCPPQNLTTSSDLVSQELGLNFSPAEWASSDCIKRQKDYWQQHLQNWQILAGTDGARLEMMHEDAIHGAEHVQVSVIHRNMKYKATVILVQRSFWNTNINYPQTLLKPHTHSWIIQKWVCCVLTWFRYKPQQIQTFVKLVELQWPCWQ